VAFVGVLALGPDFREGSSVLIGLIGAVVAGVPEGMFVNEG